MGEVIRLARHYACTTHTILISGETGTGKELMAQAIHACSQRKTSRCCPSTAPQYRKTWPNRELFGYKKGAFTGAYADSPASSSWPTTGLFSWTRSASCLPTFRPSLLRVLENGEVTPLKSKNPVRVDIRVLAATNKELEDEVRQKRFRADLFYRIDELKIHIPPLRDRKTDIIPWRNTSCASQSGRFKTDIRFSAEAQRLLADYAWPGNVPN